MNGPYRTPHPPARPSERAERYAYAFMAVFVIGMPATAIAYRMGQQHVRDEIPSLLSFYDTQPRNCPNQGVTVRVNQDGAEVRCSGSVYRVDVVFEPRQSDFNPGLLVGPWIAERPDGEPRSQWSIHRWLERLPEPTQPERAAQAEP